MEKESGIDALYKFILIGESDVGKTSIMHRYNKGWWLEEPSPTVGVDFINKFINVNGTKVKIQLWDTAGQEKFRSINSAYYK